MPAFFCKKSAFFGKNSTFTQCMNFLNSASRIWLPNCSKLTINQKKDNDVTIFRHDIIIKFLWRCFVSLVRFSYWSTFHVSIITGSGIMTIFFYKGLTRNPEIGNTLVWVLPNIWRLGWVRDTKFGTNISNEMLVNVAECQGYSFYRFWVIKGKLSFLLIWYKGLLESNLK